MGKGVNERTMNITYVVGSGISLALFVYLLIALLRPEVFS